MRRDHDAQEESPLASKVFVGNLSFETTTAELQAAFAEAGPVVEVFIPTDRATGRPRGFAFVELESDEVMEAAIKQLDGFELKGRRLRVNKAEERPPRGPRPPRPPRFAGSGSGGGPPSGPTGGGFGDAPGFGGGDGGFGGYDGGGGGDYRKADAPPKRSRPKGSRRNARGKKRSI